MKCCIFISLLVLLLACPSPIPPQPSPPPIEPTISAVVHAVPDYTEILFEGENIGQSPAKVRVHSIDQLTNSFSAANLPEGAVEERISIIGENEIEVTLLFDRDLSKMAKALNLAKVLVFDYGESVTFDFNKSEIKQVFKPYIEKQAEMLRKNFSGIDVYVCGHSDNIGRRDRNLELSLARAESVRNELLELGVPKADIKIQGFGSDYPLVSNETEAGRARNRRIEIILGR